MEVKPTSPVLCARTKCGKDEQLRSKLLKIKQKESWFPVFCYPSDGCCGTTRNHLTAGHPKGAPATLGSQWQLTHCSQPLPDRPVIMDLPKIQKKNLLYDQTAMEAHKQQMLENIQ